jgi:hypothetical protein
MVGRAGPSAQSLANDQEVVLGERGELNADECLVDAGRLRFRNVYHFENIDRIAMGFDLDSFHNEYWPRFTSRMAEMFSDFV